MKALLSLFEEKGKYSSKRLITVFSFLVMVAAFSANTFFGLPISEFLIDNFMYIIIGGMGITTAASVSNAMLGRDKKVTKSKTERVEITQD